MYQSFEGLLVVRCSRINSVLVKCNEYCRRRRNATSASALSFRMGPNPTFNANPNHNPGQSDQCMHRPGTFTSSKKNIANAWGSLALTYTGMNVVVLHPLIRSRKVTLPDIVYVAFVFFAGRVLCAARLLIRPLISLISHLIIQECKRTPFS